MPSYTFPAAVVLIEATGQLAIGATGVLLDDVGGTAQLIYDLNGSPISNVQVGPLGVHQPFKADIADGILDFGSVLLPSISKESLSAGIQAQASAAASAAGAASAASSAAAASASLTLGADIREALCMWTGTAWPNRPTGFARVRWISGVTGVPSPSAKMAVGDIWEEVLNA